MKIRGSVVSQSFTFPQPPEDEKNKNKISSSVVDTYLVTTGVCSSVQLCWVKTHMNERTINGREGGGAAPGTEDHTTTPTGLCCTAFDGHTGGPNYYKQEEGVNLFF